MANTAPQSDLHVDFNVLLKRIIKKIEDYQGSSEKYDIKKRHVLYTLNKIINTNRIDYAHGRPYTYTRLRKLIETNYFSLHQFDDNYIDTLFHYSQLFVKELVLKKQTPTNEEIELYHLYRNASELNINEKRLLIELETAYSGRDADDEAAKSWEEKIEVYRQELKKEYSEYNFVCLARAFMHLLKRKEKELFYQKLSIFLLGISVLLVPLTTIYFNFFSPYTLNEKPLLYIPFLACTIIFLYYFRINIQIYYNTKSQILQIEQRRALCAFAEGYAEYKSNRHNALSDKFETLIFSPIVSTPEKIPSTLDGIEQITNLIKECSAKGKL